MPATTRTTQETAPCGGPTGFPFLPRTGLNLAINAMVASERETPRPRSGITEGGGISGEAHTTGPATDATPHRKTISFIPYGGTIRCRVALAGDAVSNITDLPCNASKTASTF